MAELIVVALLILLLWALFRVFIPAQGFETLGDAILFLCTCFDVTLDSFSCFSSIFEG